MIPERIEATFPSGHRLPEAIVALCEYLGSRGYTISGCFELSGIGMDDVRG